MAINGIGNSAAAATGRTDKAQEDLNKTYNDFLLLLTTQLKNQDPTSPMETNEFTQQLASLSSVQEQVNTNKNLENLISIISGGQLNNMVNYIGRVVEAEGNSGVLIEEGALFAYDLPQEAASATITIMDGTGKAVYSGVALKAAGRNEVVWDGTNSFTSQKMPQGIYQYKITAKDGSDKTIDVKTYTTGIVTSVDTLGGEAKLNIGSLQVPLDDIVAIRSAQELL